MYEINVDNRRVTQYIIEEAYKWLYDKINAGEYKTNKCKKGKELVLKIKEEQRVTTNSYDQFVGLFVNSPFWYMMYYSKRQSMEKITTDHLFNYFVKYNGVTLPLGFIKDFFEDDYETNSQITDFLKKYGQGCKNEIVVQWRKTLIDKENEIDKIKNSLEGVLKPHPMLLITQFVRLLLVGFLASFFITFLKAVHFVEIISTFTTELGFNLNASIQAKETISVFALGGNIFCNQGDFFTIAEYFTHYCFHFIVGIFVLIVLISRTKKLVSFFIYLGKVLIWHIRFFHQKLIIHRFDEKGVDSIADYFALIIPEMAENRKIQSSFCFGIPKIKRCYYSINQINLQRMEKKLTGLMEKSLKCNFVYKSTKDSQAIKKKWRKGLIKGIIFNMLIAIIMVPSLYDLVAYKAINFFNSLFG